MVGERIKLQAVILAGGMGTRLRGIVNDIPKTMAIIKGKPFLEYIICQLVRFQVKDIIICVGYLGNVIEEYFGNGFKWGVSIRYAREKKLLGTAGSLANTLGMLNKEFLVINGDTYVPINFRDLIESWGNDSADAMIVLCYVRDCEDYGQVKINEQKRVTNFIGRVSCQEGYVNAGVYIFKKEIIKMIPQGNVVSLEKEILPLMVDKFFVRAFVIDKMFVDIGNPERYIFFKKNFCECKLYGKK